MCRDLVIDLLEKVGVLFPHTKQTLLKLILTFIFSLEISNLNGDVWD